MPLMLKSSNAAFPSFCSVHTHIVTSNANTTLSPLQQPPKNSHSAATSFAWLLRELTGQLVTLRSNEDIEWYSLLQQELLLIPIGCPFVQGHLLGYSWPNQVGVPSRIWRESWNGQLADLVDLLTFHRFTSCIILCSILTISVALLLLPHYATVVLESLL